jgi:WD40 repeat protein
MVRVWDWRTGRLACPPFEHPDETRDAAFTPDGGRVLTACIAGFARAWDWRTGKPVTPPLPVEGRPLDLAITPDGRRAIVGGFVTALAVLDLADLAPDARDDPDLLVLRAELASGRRLHEGGETNLTLAEWLERWRRRRPAADGR